MNASDAPPLVIATSTLLVEYSVDGMKRRIAWRGGEASVIVEESEAPSGIELADVALGPMRVNTGETHRARIVDPELGPCEELLISGSATGGDATIEKVCQVRIPEAFPHVVITRTRFKNAGSAAVRIRRVESERVRLNRRLADPTAQSFEFASYHGAPRFWGTEYNLVRLQPGFFQRNLFGQHRMDDPDGSGGGMPLVDLWCKTMGVALAHIEKSPQWLSMPVRVLDDGTVSASIVEEPSVTLGQVEVLEPGQQYEAATTALIFHRGDYHDPLRTFAELLRRRGVAIPQTSPDWAYEPYWKTWGFGADFRVSEVLALLEQLRSFEIGICNLDDGWFDFAGDWNPDTSPHKFPEGDTSMESFVERLHREGMRSSLWWYPLGVHPDSQLARQHPEMLVTDETGQPALDPNKLHQLCPAYPPARQHIIRTLRRILADWGFDGVYLDWCGLSAVPACHNPHHRHERPLDAFEAVPEVFADIHREAHQIHRDPLIEVCICSYPHSPTTCPTMGSPMPPTP
jgi:alpha-galactosidase